MVDLFQSLDNRFFHDRLDIGRAEELTLDGVCLRYPELSVFRDKFLPRERFCRFKEFIVRFGVDLSYFEQDTLGRAKEQVDVGDSLCICKKRYFSILHALDFVAEVENFTFHHRLQAEVARGDQFI